MNIVDIYKTNDTDNIINREEFKRLEDTSITCGFEYQHMFMFVRLAPDQYRLIRCNVIFTEDRVMVNAYSTWDQSLSLEIYSDMLFYCPFTCLVVTAKLYSDEWSIVLNRAFDESFSLIINEIG